MSNAKPIAAMAQTSHPVVDSRPDAVSPLVRAEES
jgi:hypothetical protein